MKIALLSDIHLGARGDSELFFNATLKFFEEDFFPRLIQEGITQVFLLGDIWDKRKIINIFTLQRTLEEIFDRFESQGIQVTAILGNHDVYYKNTNDVNSIKSLLDRYPNVRIIQKYEVMEIYGINFGFVSWLNPSDYDEKLRWIASCNAEILMGHFEIKNLQLPDGTEYSDGLEQNVFNRFEYVVSGHYHVRTFVGGKFYYLGSPVEHTWNDCGVKKGFTIFDCQTRTFEFVPNSRTMHEKIFYEDGVTPLLTFPYHEYAGKIVAVYIPSFLSVNVSQYNLFLDSLSAHCYSLETREYDGTDSSSVASLQETSPEMGDTRTLIDSYITTVFSELEQQEELRSYVRSLQNAALSMEVD